MKSFYTVDSVLNSYTLRNNGPRKVLPGGLRFYPEPFACGGNFLGLSGVLGEGSLFIHWSIFGRKSSLRIVEIFKELFRSLYII